MGSSLLPRLVEAKLHKQGLSIRKAARQIGVAHTTLSRILQGDNADMTTMRLLAEWLEIDLSTVVDVKGGDLATRLAAVLEAAPELRALFEDALLRLEQGDIAPSVVEDLVAYAAFRIGRPTEG